MKIIISNRRAAAVEAVLCVVGLPVDRDGWVNTQFYPVDKILEQRYTDKVLQGHPLLDLQTEEGGLPGIMETQLRPGQVRELSRRLAAGRMVAVSITNIGRPNRKGEREERIRFYYVPPTDYLTEADIHWLTSVCETGELFYEQALERQR